MSFLRWWYGEVLLAVVPRYGTWAQPLGRGVSFLACGAPDIALYCFYMILYSFYMILNVFFMILCGFHLIFGGVAEFFGCPVVLYFNVFPDFERST